MAETIVDTGGGDGKLVIMGPAKEGCRSEFQLLAEMNSMAASAQQHAQVLREVAGVAPTTVAAGFAAREASATDGNRTRGLILGIAGIGVALLTVGGFIASARSAASSAGEVMLAKIDALLARSRLPLP